jgi:hypothetical protein
MVVILTQMRQQSFVGSFGRLAIPTKTTGMPEKI